MEVKQFYYKSNRLQQLRGFCYVVQQGGVQKAAKFMGLTQSTVTQQIQALERDLNVTLFNREKRSLSLTEDGKIFYSLAMPQVQSIDSLYEEFLYHRENSKKKTIDISANHSVIIHLLPKILSSFREQYPEVNLVIRNIGRKDASRRLLDNETDLAFFPMTEIPEEFEFIPVIDYDPVLLVRKDHYFADKKNVRLEEVAKHDVVRIDPHLITLPMFEETVKHYKVGSNINFENGDWEILKSFVRENIGIAILDGICVSDDDPDLVTLPLTRYFPRMTYGAFYSKGKVLSPHHKALIDTITASADEVHQKAG